MQVLRLYDTNKNYLKTLNDFHSSFITEKINQLTQFTFYTSSLDGIMEEGLVETPGQIYTIKAIDTLVSGYKVTCEQNVDGLRETYLGWNTYETLSIQRLLFEILLDSEWDFKDHTTNKNFKRTIVSEGHNVFSLIPTIIKTYEVELVYDTTNKIIHVYNEVGDETGSYFDSELNIDSSTLTSDTYQFYTRIIPEGKDGLTIESINNGKNYLDNNKYSNKVITYYWKDERYTVVENLKEDAQRKLDKMAKPYRTVDIQVRELSHIDKYNFLKVSLGDTVIVNDKELKIRDKFRIIEKVSYLDDPEKNTFVISNFNESFLDIINNQITEDIEQVEQVVQNKFEQTQDKMDQLKEDVNKETDEKLQDYEDRFDAELAKAPETTLEWLNNNTGVLDGDVLMLESVKTKHHESGSITAELIAANAIIGKHIQMDSGFIDKISSNVSISDLVMTGLITDGISYWDLTKQALNIGDKIIFQDGKLIMNLEDIEGLDQTILDKLSQIKVGGTNLYTNSRWTAPYITNREELEEVDLENKVGIIFPIGYTYIYSNNTKRFDEGDYVISFTHKGETVKPDNKIFVSDSPAENTDMVFLKRESLGDDWYRSSYTFYLDGYFEDATLMVGFDLKEEKLIHSIKIEKGTLPTDWSVAPEDLDVEDRLEIIGDRIDTTHEILADKQVDNEKRLELIEELSRDLNISLDDLEENTIAIDERVSGLEFDNETLELSFEYLKGEVGLTGAELEKLTSVISSGMTSEGDPYTEWKAGRGAVVRVGTDAITMETGGNETFRVEDGSVRASSLYVESEIGFGNHTARKHGTRFTIFNYTGG